MWRAENSCTAGTTSGKWIRTKWVDVRYGMVFCVVSPCRAVIVIVIQPLVMMRIYTHRTPFESKERHYVIYESSLLSNPL